MAELEIVAPGPADAEGLAELAERTFRDAFAAANDPQHMDQYAASAFATERILVELDEPDTTFLVARLGGEMVGYSKLRCGPVPECVVGPRIVELHRIYLDQSVIGGGYGSALLEHTLELARRRGHRTLWLGVWENNERALAFYRRWGFEVVGSHVFALGDDLQTDLLMQRSLDLRP